MNYCRVQIVLKVYYTPFLNYFTSSSQTKNRSDGSVNLTATLQNHSRFAVTRLSFHESSLTNIYLYKFSNRMIRVIRATSATRWSPAFIVDFEQLSDGCSDSFQQLTNPTHIKPTKLLTNIVSILCLASYDFVLSFQKKKKPVAVMAEVNTLVEDFRDMDEEKFKKVT